MTTEKQNLLPALQQYAARAEQSFDQIPDTRKEELAALAHFVQEQVKAGKEAKLIFICTHNSRRSHISQIWAQAAAAYYGIPGVKTFSGGTEATAFNPRAVKAMQDAGFRILVKEEGTNPVYAVHYAQEAQPLEIWSKAYDDAANPTEAFAAIMTCSHADEHCPIIPGAQERFPIRYEDPKAFDDSPLEAQKYGERTLQIAREMLYAFSCVKIK